MFLPKSNDARTFKGTPPCDGREWKSIVDAQTKLGVNRSTVWYHIHRQGWTIYRQNRARTWVLKEDVERSLAYWKMRKRWLERHQPKTWREEVCRDFDGEMCARIFWTAEQAATIYSWGKRGKVPVFIAAGEGKRARKWFSPSSLRHMKDNVEHLKWRAAHEKAKETMRAGVVERQVYKLQHKPFAYRKPIPRGWLTVREVADRMQISQARVRKLQLSGRLRGKQWYKGNLEELGNWEKAPHRRWFFHEGAVDELMSMEDYQLAQERGKANAQRRK